MDVLNAIIFYATILKFLQIHGRNVAKQYCIYKIATYIKYNVRFEI
jgi:hypothetical protein